MYCNKCGNVVPDHLSSCNVCGAVMAQPAPKVGMIKALKLYFSRYAEFSGRSRRSEYWWATFAIMLINGLLTAIFGFVLPIYANINLPWITLIWSLVTLIPSFALCIRRLHDAGKSGWWYLWNLVPLIGSIVVLVQFCSDSVPDNQWGPNPKVAARPAAPIPQPRQQVMEPPRQQFAVQPRTQPVVQPQETKTVYNPPMEVPAPAPAAPVRPAARAAVVLMTGPLAGKGFYCEEGRSITVGRDPARANVGLSPYRAVSGVHCSISAGNGYVTVTDLGSSNGTYVDGTRLMPNQPVRAGNGSSILLADANCTLQVRIK